MTYIESALSVIKNESQAIYSLTDRLNDDFNKACDILLDCKGRVIVTGMGKSGHIAGKISATLSSTGTPSFFMHPAEASHGDLGMITKQDVIIAISYSGHTPEIITLLPLIKSYDIPIIALTSNKTSTLGKNADIVLDIGIETEACPLGLAPTTSTTVTLVMGDALAVALLKAKGFSRNDFAKAHPGGSLGKQLLLKVTDIAHKGHDLPIVKVNVSIRDALIETTDKKLGMTCVVHEDGTLAGIYTDGDVRRTLSKTLNIHNTAISAVMTTSPVTIPGDLLATQALKLMQSYKITTLIIVENNQPTGVVHMHDILKSGITE